MIDRELSRPFYDSKKWKTTRKAYLESQHYLCERCGGLASIVHHRQHITPETIDDPAITLNWENLEALCLDCHNSEHFKKSKPCIDGLEFDENGDIVKARPPMK